MFLERALLFTIVIHAVAMVSMALLLLPGLPGGTHELLHDRISYIANHPWRWRLGWFPWQLTALSDLLIAAALLRTPWIPRGGAITALVFTLVAIWFEQPSEFRWITQGVQLAQQAVQQGSDADYQTFEELVFRDTSINAALFYTLAAVAWSWCFFKAGTWNGTLTFLSVVTWSLFLYVTAGLYLPIPLRPSLTTISVSNGIGFCLLLLWLTLVTELVLRRSRLVEPHGRLALWTWPVDSRFAPVVDGVANCRILRAFGEYGPTLVFVSDISDVIYVNYLVDASRLEHLVPAGLELQRLGANGQYAMFTFLTFRHGHFGPRFLGPLRQLLPSPIQSNWRIHVRDPQTGVQGIYFVTTSISNAVNAIAARMLSEGVSMHVPKRAELTGRPDGSIHLEIDPGVGTSPDVHADLCSTADVELHHPWSDCWSSFQEMLAYCVPQDRAMSSQAFYRRVTRQEIQLDIPLKECEPLAGKVTSRFAHSIVGDAKPLCFKVAKVHFRYLGDRFDRRHDV